MRLIIDDIGIGISRLENRKRPSLVIITKNEERVVASFQGEIATVAFQEHLIKFIEAIGARVEHDRA